MCLAKCLLSRPSSPYGLAIGIMAQVVWECNRGCNGLLSGIDELHSRRIICSLPKRYGIYCDDHLQCRIHFQLEDVTANRASILFAEDGVHMNNGLSVEGRDVANQ